jgi:hypothetical protein
VQQCSRWLPAGARRGRAWRVGRRELDGLLQRRLLTGRLRGGLAYGVGEASDPNVELLFEAGSPGAAGLPRER